MADEQSENEYDAVVLGTGLAESIVAASLAKASHKVLHLDSFPAYGGPRHASLTIPELLDHLLSLPHASHSFIEAQDGQPNDFEDQVQNGSLGRQYAISLYPAMLPARGKLIDTLISSGVSGYIGFRIVDGVGIGTMTDQEVDNSAASCSRRLRVKRVPSSKAHVFKSKDMSLLDKRKLMKMLTYVLSLEDVDHDAVVSGKQDMGIVSFLTTSFGLSTVMAKDIAFGIAHVTTGNEPALETLLRLQRYLKSMNRYAPNSSFLLAQFGGVGEIVQGFCRSCAVYGGTYILGDMAQVQHVNMTQRQDSRIDFRIKAQETTMSTKRIIASKQAARAAGLLPQHTDDAPINESHEWSNGIAILDGLPESIQSTFANADQPDQGDDEDSNNHDVLYITIPPATEDLDTGDQRASRVLLMGSGTGSCPDGQYVMYIQTPVGSPSKHQDPGTPPAQAILQQFATRPLFQAYYTSRSDYEPTLPGAGVSAADEKLIVLDDYMEAAARLDSTISSEHGTSSSSPGEPQWLQGLDFEALVAQAVVDKLGVPMLCKQDELGAQNEDEDS